MTFLFALISLFLFAEIKKSSQAAFSIQHSTSKEKISAKSYVQNGLFAQFDGIENVEYGKHDSTSTTWINLKENPIIKNALFNENSAIPTQTMVTDGRLSDFRISGDFTLHSCLVVCPFKWYNWTMIGIGTGAGMQNGIVFSGMDGNRGNIVCYRKAYSGTILNFVQTGLQQGQACIIDIVFQYSIKTYFVYVDGICVGQSQISDENWNLDNVNVSIGCQFHHYTDMGNFRIYDILFYKRMLTQDEISYNYEIDKMRFGL